MFHSPKVVGKTRKTVREFDFAMFYQKVYPLQAILGETFALSQAQEMDSGCAA
jgi:hypothetical protein